MSIEYRIASVADCEELTRLRMKMRGELDADFCEDDLYLPTLDFFRLNIGRSDAEFIANGRGALQKYGFERAGNEFEFYIN